MLQDFLCVQFVLVLGIYHIFDVLTLGIDFPGVYGVEVATENDYRVFECDVGVERIELELGGFCLRAGDFVFEGAQYFLELFESLALGGDVEMRGA